MRSLLLIGAFLAAPALAQVTVEDAWMRATPPGAKIAAGYMTIRNGSAAPDRLVAITSPAAERIETHTTVKDGDVSRMREVKGYAIPAKGRFELRPGGAHLMFVNIKAPFEAGQSVDAVLKFEKAGEVKARFEVRPLGASSTMHEHGHAH